MKRPGYIPAVPDLPPNRQALLSQALCLGRLALTQGNQRSEPGAQSNPVPGTELGDDRLSLLELVTDGLDGCCIPLGEPPESGCRQEEAGSYSEVIACFPI